MLVHECSVGAAETAETPKRVAWVWQDAIPSYNCPDWGGLKFCAHLCHPWEDISARGFCGFCEFCGRMQWLLGWCSGDHCTPL